MQLSKIKVLVHLHKLSHLFLIGLPVLSISWSLMSGCAESNTKKKNDKNSSINDNTPQDQEAAKREILAKNQATEPGAFFKDYPLQYCKNVWKLKLREDVSEYLKYFCDGETPTQNMLEWRRKLILEPGKVDIKEIFYEGNKEKETSERKIVWGYYIENLRPFRVKEQPFYSYISKSYQDEFINLKSTAERQSDENLDFGLHLWNTKMFYNLQLTAAPGLILPSLRDTQYNLYQVESGNEEMGLGVETLTNGHNGDYTKSVMLNLSFNDGRGFNDEKGGTLVINMLHLKMANKGFVETTEKTLKQLGNFLALSMFEGLTNKKN